MAAMFVRFRHLFGWLTGVFRSPADLILENLALRQQLLALHAQRPRPQLGSLDRLFWVTLRRLWSGWRKPLVVVTPERLSAGIAPAFDGIGLGARGLCAAPAAKR